ncbi:multicopper oxidase family protein [Corynebacterium lubricantis]|uniref:multicopper oxidase family protein n=1 Tax=Corynebacterium lubricantis TaxID=541095 RepID=UPI000370C5E4|nr:multicopper oxidase family protein [Corynebacterium lubricantis]
MNTTPARGPKIVRRIVVTVLILGLAGLGLYWFLSLAPGAYSLAPSGGYGHGHGSVASPSTDIASLIDDPARPADVQLRIEAQLNPSGGFMLNGASPGPEIRAVKGDMVEVDFHNVDIAEGTTLHWHGIDVPAAMDGVAGVTQDAVKPGESFTYRFIVDDPGTYWYHSHQVSHRQVIGGLFGVIIVDPEGGLAEQEVTLPLHTYPGESRTIAGWGTGRGAEQRVQAEPGSVWRVRVINTDNPSAFVWTESARLVAIDGHDLNEPALFRDKKIRLGAGARADLEVTVPESGAARVQAPGVSLILGDGDPAMLPAPAQELDLLSYGAPADVGFDVSQADQHFNYVINRRPGFLNGKPGYWWTVNGRIGHAVPPFMVKEGELIAMEIRNKSADVHPMHLHGHHFLVVSRDGVRSTGTPWWTDSLDILSGETYEVVFPADNPGIWMNHCHNLPHAVDGLMTHLSYEGITTDFMLGRKSGNEPE